MTVIDPNTVTGQEHSFIPPEERAEMEWVKKATGGKE